MTFRRRYACRRKTMPRRADRRGENQGGFLFITLLQSTLCVLMISAAFVISGIMGMTEIKPAFFSLISKDTQAVEVFSALEKARDSEKLSRLREIAGLIFDYAFGERASGQGGMLEVTPQSAAVPDGVTDASPLISSPMKLPVSGDISSTFGLRQHPITQSADWHSGVDWAVAKNTAVGAAWPGTVCETGESAVYGRFVTLEHGNFKTRYCHCERIVAGVGMRLRQGETVALSGSTGVSTGPHLHFEVIIDGKCADPLARQPQWRAV